MKQAGLSLAVSFVTASVLATGPVQTTPRDAVARLAKARAALGGEVALGAVKSLSVTLRWRSRQGGPATEGKPPIYSAEQQTYQILLPDHFLASDAGRDQSELARATGRTIPPGRPATEGFAGAADIGSRLMKVAVRERFGYFMLQCLLATDTAYPFTLRRVTGDTLHFTDPKNVAVMIDLDPVTNRPLRWRYEPVGVTNPVELPGYLRPRRMEIGDWRRVGNLLLPHKFTMFQPQSETMMTEELIGSILINPTLSKSDFK